MFGDIQKRGGFGNAGSHARDSRIARGREDLHTRRLRQLPTQGMLAPAASED
jgi:ribosomal protein L15